jgi:hypothetical protein
MPSITQKWGWGFLFVVGGLLLLVLVAGLYLNIFGGKVLQKVVSPDGRTVADIRGDDEFAAATDVAHSAIELRSGLNPFRYSVFFYVNRGATVTISWIDANNLRVDCGDTCDHLEVVDLKRSWNGITIHYSPDLIRGTRWYGRPGG